jgi:hypothetical protein
MRVVREVFGQSSGNFSFGTVNLCRFDKKGEAMAISHTANTQLTVLSALLSNKCFQVCCPQSAHRFRNPSRAFSRLAQTELEMQTLKESPNVEHH